MKITPDDVRKVGLLARLDVGDEEVDGLTDHFNSILEHFGKLDELDLSDVDPLALEEGVPLRLRKDSVTTRPDREAILKQSPSRDGDFIRVPRIGGDA